MTIGERSMNEASAHVAPLIHMALTDDHDVHGDQQIAERPPQPHRFLGSVLDVRLDDEEVKIAVPPGIPACVGAEEDHSRARRGIMQAPGRLSDQRIVDDGWTIAAGCDGSAHNPRDA